MSDFIEAIFVGFVGLIAVAFSAMFVAWFTLLPAIGALYLLGMLK